VDPSLIAEIRDVLRTELEIFANIPLTEANERELRTIAWVKTRARDALARFDSLLSRIEAQGEAPTPDVKAEKGQRVVVGQVDSDLIVTRALVPDLHVVAGMPSAYESVPSVTTNSTDAPASADQGSGRATPITEQTAFTQLKEWLASEYSRGEAAGRAEADRWKRHYGDLMALRAQHIGEATAAGRLSGIEEAAVKCDALSAESRKQARSCGSHENAQISRAYLAEADAFEDAAEAIRQRALTLGGTT